MRKIYWYVSAFLRKHGWKVLLAFVVTFAFFSVFLPYVFRNIEQTSRYYIGVVGEFHLDNLPTIITQQISSGLTVEQIDGSFLPDLAERISIEDEGRLFRFTLPIGLRWQDGTDLVPSDIVYNLPGVSVEFTEHEIIYTLEEAFAPLPQYVSMPLIRLQSERRWGLIDRVRVIGIGEYELTTHRSRDRSPYSALQEVIVDNRINRSRYIYRFYPTEEHALLAFKKGEVDFLFDIADPESIYYWDNVLTRERGLYNQYIAVFFNNDEPIFNRSIRQALSYAIEKERSGMRRVSGPIPSTSWAYFRGIKDYDKNMEQAVARMLDELPGEPMQLRLTTLSVFHSIATDIARQWEELGVLAREACLEDNSVTNRVLCENLAIGVEINIQNFPDLNNYQILLMGKEVFGDPDQYSLWHSEAPTNFTNYQNTRVDALLEQGRQTILQSERVSIYQEFQQVLLEDPPAVWLWAMRTYDIARR
ncbi:MAG: ABC transporter substrate-binding protein [Pseudomonadales bacterium]|jgi:peptide/nickel transport system substrate-binding protein|nr:ABC transporter substrate-binding protein [Pseudomonadales bacterium]